MKIFDCGNPVVISKEWDYNGLFLISEIFAFLKVVLITLKVKSNDGICVMVLNV